MKNYLYIVLGLVVAFVLGKYSSPTKTEVKEVIKTVTVVKEVTKKDERGTIHEKEVIRKDGTKEITRSIVYQKEESQEKESKSSTESLKISKSTNLPEHQVGLLYNLKTKDDNKYSITYQKRIFSSLYIGGFASTDVKEYGLSISLGF